MDTNIKKGLQLISAGFQSIANGLAAIAELAELKKLNTDEVKPKIIEPIKEEPIKEEPIKEEPKKEEPKKEKLIKEDPIEEDPKKGKVTKENLIALISEKAPIDRQAVISALNSVGAANLSEVEEKEYLELKKQLELIK